MSTQIEEPQIEVDVEPEEDIRPAKGYVVVLHNDNHHTFVYVIEVLCKVVETTVDQAEALAREIHEKGKAVVAGPMSNYEAKQIANKIASYGPDPWSSKPKTNIGLKVTVEEA